MGNLIVNVMKMEYITATTPDIIQIVLLLGDTTLTETVPVIALNKRSSSSPEPSGTADEVNKDGIPLCPCGGPIMTKKDIEFTITVR